MNLKFRSLEPNVDLWMGNASWLVTSVQTPTFHEKADTNDGDGRPQCCALHCCCATALFAFAAMHCAYSVLLQDAGAAAVEPNRADVNDSVGAQLMQGDLDIVGDSLVRAVVKLVTRVVR